MSEPPDAAEEQFRAMSEPTEQAWFETRVRYEGMGEAEFGDPHGIVAGPAWVEFDETGLTRGGLDIQRFAPAEELPMGIFQFFQQDRPEQTEEGYTLALDLDSRSNECVRLTIVADDGVFSAWAPIGYSHTMRWSVDDGGGYSLKFQFFNGAYHRSSAPPRYWVLPLINFVSGLRPAALEESEHPLRLLKFPALPDDSDPERRSFAIINRRNRNRIELFAYRGHRAHIEPMLDYSDRVSRLEGAHEHRLVTALMVGDLPAQIRSVETLDDFLPYHLLVSFRSRPGPESDRLG